MPSPVAIEPQLEEVVPGEDESVSLDLGSRAARRLASGARLRAASDGLEADERKQAMRLLLMQPMLPAEGPTAEAYRLVWRHAAELRDWLLKMAGWTLVLQGDLARLRKIPADLTDASRGAVDPCSDQPLTRSRYALLCLVLAVLEGEQRQTTLRQVAERTQLLANADVRLRALGFEFDLTKHDCRRDLVSVFRLLVSMCAMSRDDGDDEQFVQGTGDALYRIHRPVLAALLCINRPPSMLPVLDWNERLAVLHETELPDSDEVRNRELRHQLVRRLLDGPVLYFHQLTEQEMSYLTSQRWYLLDEIEHATGLVAEIRQEGIALLDPYGDCSDVGLPEVGTRGHVTLLLAQWLASRLRDGVADGVTWADVDQTLSQLVDVHRAHWRKGVDQPAVRQALATEVIFRLEALGLVEIRRGEIQPRPAIARYALQEDVEN